MKLLNALYSWTLVGSASAVLYGDEQYGDKNGGKFWVFNSNGVSIVDPDECKVVKTISSDSDGNLLPGRWYDGVFMRHDTNNKDYVAINSAVTVSDSHGQDGGSGEVLFFDAVTEEVVSRVLVGPRPVHSYCVHTQNQYWTHADGDGFFYVVSMDDLDRHSGNPVKVKIEEANHGKLLWDESDLLQGIGYATSTGETHLFIIDLEQEEQIGTVDFSSQEGCRGAHAIGFSSANQHLYLECTGPGGTLEFDVSSPRSPVFVKQHTDISGAIYESPDGSHISISDKGGNKFHLLEPQGTGVASSVAHSVTVEGHPSTPVWYPKSVISDQKGSLDYHVCMPLTSNTNQNHYNDDGELVCDYYGCGPAKNAQDVLNGLCLHDAGGRSLLTANSTTIEDVQAGRDPYNAACQRCADVNNYDGADGICTCTPNCGSCATNEAKEHKAELSGVTCLDTAAVIASDGQQYDTTFVAAGSVKQGSPYSYSAECGFGRTYRSHKRGGVYDAVPADYPKPALHLVDMRDFKQKCAVELPGSPFRIIYVPPPVGGVTYTEEDSTSKASLPGGALAGIVAACVVGVLIIGLALLKLRSGGDGGNVVRNQGTTQGSPEMA